MLRVIRTSSSIMGQIVATTWLDRCVVRLQRLLRYPPRGTGLVLAVGFIGATIVYGAQTGPVWSQLRQAYGTPFDMAANMLGLRVERVAITGRQELSDRDILAAAGVTGVHSLLFLDAEAAREGLEKLPFVKSAQVRKLFPSTLSITLDERAPYALWQRDGTVSLIARDGTLLASTIAPRFANLPLVVGEGADARVQEIVTAIDNVPLLKKRIRGATLVSRRRWNVTLDNGVVVRLPEQGLDTALLALAGLARDANVLDKDILAIDLRQPDRAIFRLSEQAAAARSQMIAKRTPKGDRA